jgi:hypothetical protein
MLFGSGRAYRRFVKLRRREGGDELCNHFVLSGVGMCSYSDVEKLANLYST